MKYKIETNFIARKTLKTMLSVFACILFGACSVEHDRTISPKTVQAQGGVDVGNMSSQTASIPATLATIYFPGSWTSKVVSQTLEITNGNSSTVRANKSQISKLIAPTQSELIEVLKSKYPDRQYQPIEINGLKGIRADLVNSETMKVSDVYLDSEFNYFIHIYSELNNTSNGIAEGEEIISTTKLKYKGEAIINSFPKTIVFENHNKYSFAGDCFLTTSVDSNCRGVSIELFDGTFSLGNRFVDDLGRIIELGTETDIPFDSIQVNGDYLIAPNSKIAISDIYTTFSPQNKNTELRSAELKKGFVYLIRTMRWPEEDLVLKLRVDSSDEKIQLTYQKLISVSPVELQRQVDVINQNTIQNEMILDSGEVTLYNQSVWKNSNFASFNFEFSTSGNRFIHHENWDITYTSNSDGKPSLTIPSFFLSKKHIFRIETKDIDLVSKEDFPSPNFKDNPSSVRIRMGETYGIVNHTFDKQSGHSVYGAVKVLDIAQNGSWVKLKFRRISVGKAEHFQNWVEENLPTDQLQEISTNYRSFFPYGNQFRLTLDRMRFNFSNTDNDSLSTTNKLYGKERGLFNFGKSLDINQIKLEDLESKVNSYNDIVTIEQDDLIGVYLENYDQKAIFLIKIVEHQKGERVKFLTRYFLKSAAKYEKKPAKSLWIEQ